jgi:hypothetical protein
MQHASHSFLKPSRRFLATSPWRFLDGSNFYQTVDALSDSADDHRESSRVIRHLPVVLVTSTTCSNCASLKRTLSTLYPHFRPSFRYPASSKHEFKLDLFEVDAMESPGVVNDLETFALPSMYLFQRGEDHEMLDIGLEDPRRAKKLPEEAARKIEETVAQFALELDAKQ